MEKLRLVEPDPSHKEQYEDMMAEWEKYGGRLNPGALRRWSNSRQRQVTYEEWLDWIAADKAHWQELFFLSDGRKIYGAITIRAGKNSSAVGLDGHCGYGIRPSERRKGLAGKMLAMALPMMRDRGINPIIITCDKDNVGSAKTVLSNRGELVREVRGERTGNVVQVFEIRL